MNRSMSFSGYPHHHHDHDHKDAIIGHLANDQDQDHDHDNHHHHDGGDQEEMSDDGSQVLVVGPGGGAKKKRLNMEQVRTLEKTFEQGNKLEPERKVQLAKALGLQPRQVAIWLQNRRARWKTKQLEKDYRVLKRQFDSLKADNDSLLAQNKKLHSQLISLRNREGAEYGAINLNNTDTKSYWSNNGSEISSDINLGTSRTCTPQTGSPLFSNPSTKLNHFPSNNCNFIPTTTSITHLLQTSPSKPELDPPVQDDTFCNIFVGGDNGGIDQNQTPPPFWAWPEQQHLN